MCATLTFIDYCFLPLHVLLHVHFCILCKKGKGIQLLERPRTPNANYVLFFNKGPYNPLQRIKFA